MDAKDKALQLIQKSKPYVNGYIGSSFLTGTEYPEAITDNARKVALLIAEEVKRTIDSDLSLDDSVYEQGASSFWGEVITSIPVVQ